uniref:Uncharacterized protein n=1 Tax=Anguilla anguilla TaxID=7936 RepID=A0A0E9UIT0_ANGAN
MPDHSQCQSSRAPAANFRNRSHFVLQQKSQQNDLHFQLKFLLLANLYYKVKEN